MIVDLLLIHRKTNIYDAKTTTRIAKAAEGLAGPGKLGHQISKSQSIRNSYRKHLARIP